MNTDKTHLPLQCPREGSHWMLKKSSFIVSSLLLVLQQLEMSAKDIILSMIVANACVSYEGYQWSHSLFWCAYTVLQYCWYMCCFDKHWGLYLYICLTCNLQVLVLYCTRRRLKYH
jgi:hypothetical protein